MTTLLLILIYIVFISFGLPDGVFGSAWPAMYPSLHVAVGFGGVVSLVVTAMTIVSSLATAWLTKKLGIGLLLSISTALTVTGLVGFSQAQDGLWLVLLAIPLGLGAGAIDSALNDYVANHYKAHHMNWLHAFWGIGATIGPIIFGLSLASTGDWRNGYISLAIIQAVIVILLFASMPLWRKVRENKHHIEDDETIHPSELKFGLLLKSRSVQLTFASFLLYVGVEVAIGLWLATYLVAIQGVATESAALWAGIYYGAITVGRVLTGFFVMKVGTENLIRYGAIAALCGVLLLLSNIVPAISIIGIILIGIGFAPIYPGMIHETPRRFGKAKSAKIMSLQMVGGYLGATTIPPLIGLLSTVVNPGVVMYVVLIAIVMLVVATELTKRLATAK